MPVSSRPSDKFAFLLTGPTTSRYIQDLKNVFDTLTGFYNYPAANIWVVQGADSFVDSGFFPGARQFAIGSLLSDPLILLKNIFCLNSDSFINTVNNHNTSSVPGVPPPAGENSTVVLYFTGAQNLSIPLHYNLVIRPGDLANERYIIPSDFTELIQYPRVGNSGIPLLRECLVNVIMQQDYSGSYYGSIITDATLLNNRCFSYACGSAQVSDSGSVGSKFTETWVNGLQWREVLDNLDPLVDPDANKYTDQVIPVGDLFMINLEQACQFAKKRAGLSNSGFDKSLFSESFMYLGKPSFLIQDGPGSSWWASPDIYLTHLLFGDTTKHTGHYIPDTVDPPTINNRINVVVRNTGTHPVRSYRIGVRVYGTPAAGALVTSDINGQVPSGIVLKPTFKDPIDNSLSNDNHDLFTWDTPFYAGTTHECIWAKVQLPTDDMPTHPFDFSWNVINNEEEAQRNTDEGYDPPKSASGKLHGDNFRGSKQHFYSIKNPFKERHRFILCALPEYQKSLNSAVMNWFTGGKNKKREKMKFEKFDGGCTTASFLLEGGETKTIIGEFGFKPDAKEKKVSFPIEILIDRISGSGTRPPFIPSLKGKFAAMSGFTIIITNEAVSLVCSVVDKKGEPVQDAMVHIQTVNGLSKESLPVDKRGEIILKSINPDVYQIKASDKLGESKCKIVPVLGHDTVKVTLEIISRAKKASKKS